MNSCHLSCHSLSVTSLVLYNISALSSVLLSGLGNSFYHVSYYLPLSIRVTMSVSSVPSQTHQNICLPFFLNTTASVWITERLHFFFRFAIFTGPFNENIIRNIRCLFRFLKVIVHSNTLWTNWVWKNNNYNLINYKNNHVLFIYAWPWRVNPGPGGEVPTLGVHKSTPDTLTKPNGKPKCCRGFFSLNNKKKKSIQLLHNK